MSTFSDRPDNLQFFVKKEICVQPSRFNPLRKILKIPLKFHENETVKLIDVNSYVNLSKEIKEHCKPATRGDIEKYGTLEQQYHYNELVEDQYLTFI